MADMRAQIDKKTFSSLAPAEQNFLMYSAIISLEARVSELEHKNWIKSVYALIGGIFGGMLTYFGMHMK